LRKGVLKFRSAGAGTQKSGLYSKTFPLIPVVVCFAWISYWKIGSLYSSFLKVVKFFFPISMIWIKASFTLLLTITLVVLLNSKMGSVPPLGKFMNPFGGFWANAEPRNAGKEKKLNLTGLRGEVKVVFDEQYGASHFCGQQPRSLLRAGLCNSHAPAVADGAANTLCGWPRFGDYRGGHR
jgi:hypothetical protein